MDKIKEEIEKLKNTKYTYINLESFKLYANQKRYNDYLINYLFKYYKDINKINNYCQEEDLNGNNYFAGIFGDDKNMSCIIPKRKTLFDEMVCIHELTHLISNLKENTNDYSMYNEVIAYFNEYNYLKSIHHFYSDLYETYRLNTAINASKKINDCSYSNALSHIIAYLILKKRKEDYNIKELNKINSSSNTLEKKLISKGYTI